jgi:hypothetical protein
MLAAMHTIRENLGENGVLRPALAWGAFRGDGAAQQFPRFLPIAYLLLCIPSYSCTVERDFSVSGIVKSALCHEELFSRSCN